MSPAKSSGHPTWNGLHLFSSIFSRTIRDTNDWNVKKMRRGKWIGHVSQGPVLLNLGGFCHAFVVFSFCAVVGYLIYSSSILRSANDPAGLRGERTGRSNCICGLSLRVKPNTTASRAENKQQDGNNATRASNGNKGHRKQKPIKTRNQYATKGQETGKYIKQKQSQEVQEKHKKQQEKPGKHEQPLRSNETPEQQQVANPTKKVPKSTQQVHPQIAILYMHRVSGIQCGPPLKDALKTKKLFDLTGLSRILCFGVCNIPEEQKSHHASSPLVLATQTRKNMEEQHSRYLRASPPDRHTGYGAVSGRAGSAM